MKTLTKVVFTAFFFFTLPVFGQTRITLEIPKIFSRIAGIEKTKVVVTNNTPFWGEVISSGRFVGMVGPGGTIYGWSRQLHDYTELPVMIRFYDSERRILIGVAGNVLRLSHHQVSSWTVNSREIIFPDGRNYWYGWRSPYPQADITGSEEVCFPAMAIIRSTTVVQVANATLFVCTVRVDGREVAVLNTGDLYYRSVVNYNDQSVPMQITVVFSDRGRLVGQYERTVWCGNTPHSEQHTIAPWDIKYY